MSSWRFDLPRSFILASKHIEYLEGLAELGTSALHGFDIWMSTEYSK